MNRVKKLSQKGFTIVELLIVIVIIGILAALVFVQFNNSQKKARDAERKSDLRQLAGKLAEYNAEKGSYPAAQTNVTNLCGSVLTGVPAATCVDPKAGVSYTYTPKDAGCDGTNCTGYTLGATLENEENGTTAYTVDTGQ